MLSGNSDAAAAAAAAVSLALDFNLPKLRQKWRLNLSNGVISYRCYPPDLELTLSRLALMDVVRGKAVDLKIEVIDKLLALT